MIIRGEAKIIPATTPGTASTIQYEPDVCVCGHVYHAPFGSPDRILYDTWCNHHEPHWETPRD